MPLLAKRSRHFALRAEEDPCPLPLAQDWSEPSIDADLMGISDVGSAYEPDVAQLWPWLPNRCAT